MSIAPTFCPQCRDENRIATINGPTCPHGERTGADWWPANWASMSEGDRAKWLQSLNREAA